MRGVEHLADDWVAAGGHVSGRVALLLRSAECQPSGSCWPRAQPGGSRPSERFSVRREGRRRHAAPGKPPWGFARGGTARGGRFGRDGWRVRDERSSGKRRPENAVPKTPSRKPRRWLRQDGRPATGEEALPSSLTLPWLDPAVACPRDPGGRAVSTAGSVRGPSSAEGRPCRGTPAEVMPGASGPGEGAILRGRSAVERVPRVPTLA